MGTKKIYDEKDNWDKFWKERSQKPLGLLITWVRARFITKALSSYISSNTEKGILIEAGCGSGEVSLQVAKKRGDQVILIDKSSDAIAIAKQMAGKYQVNATLLQCDIIELSKNVSPSPQNIVYNIGVVEHFDDCSVILKEMARVSGHSAIAIVPEKSLFWIIFIWLSRLMRLVPDDFVVYIYNENSFRKVIESAGMQILWAKRIRIFGVIPYLGMCFTLKSTCVK